MTLIKPILRTVHLSGLQIREVRIAASRSTLATKKRVLMWRAGGSFTGKKQMLREARRADRELVTVDLGGGVLVKDTREHLREIGAFD